MPGEPGIPGRPFSPGVPSKKKGKMHASEQWHLSSVDKDFSAMPKLLRARKTIYLIAIPSKFNSGIHHLKGTLLIREGYSLGLVENRAIDNNRV